MVVNLTDAEVVALAARAGVVGQEVTARWSPAPLAAAAGEHRVGVVSRSDGHLDLLLRLADGRVLTAPVAPGPAVRGAPGAPAPTTWGLLRIGPNGWRVTPSLHEGGFHAMLTLAEVPNPPPWEPPATAASPDGEGRR